MRKTTHSGELIIRRSKSWTASDTLPLNGDNGIDFDVVGFSVNADGNLAYRMINPFTKQLDAAVTMAVKAGITYPFCPQFIMSTNTTATGILVHG